ncbi:peptide/nickel transport system ATP-binding protein [Promicromonospora sp. AC04]|uniref:dipeptide ABC transporter ATP-binding protein n=1 Tax=Promicromonospora sp. AC04 TaxID=2135723 RepID=UPI000D34DCA8|nr:ABC transporter ATP-binding protein [Promicromonospora sp. AC04]PUB32180.1 peptide/nickel transport system ATP-binding protein [Promicromonospora sp. AC04]
MSGAVPVEPTRVEPVPSEVAPSKLVPSEPVLSVRDLVVAFPDRRGQDGGGTGHRGVRRVVDGVSFQVAAGECVAIVGESGSGKSVTARSVVGLAGEGARVSAAALTVGGQDVLSLSARRLRRLRGGTVGLIAQDALVSLDPLRPVGREIGDTLALHTGLDAAARRARTIELLDRVGLPDAELRAGQRPGELSGGQRQRALIAAGIAGEPSLVIADEPTTALDQPVQAGVLRLLGRLRDDGTAVLLISHDLSVVMGIADRVLVMTDGVVVEEGTPAEVFERPKHPYTRKLVAAVPAGRARGVPLLDGAAPAVVGPQLADGAPATAVERRGSGGKSAPGATETTFDEAHAGPSGVLLEARGLGRTFHVDGREIVAAEDVSFSLRAGRTLGLVGESGSGKSTTARLLLGLERPDAGEVTLLGEPWSPLPEARRRPRRPLVGAVFQDALSSFDPRWTVGSILADAITRGRSLRPGPVRAQVANLLDTVGLDPDLATRRPLHLSGGQRQRVSVARSLAADPRVLILDEPVSALDVSVQAQVLDLLDRLQRERDLAYLLITHDLGVALHMSDDIAVMRAGRIIESGQAGTVFDDPRDPYARLLRDASPIAAREAGRS